MGAPWKRAAVERLLALGRAGEPWRTIGLVFYPEAPWRRAKTAASMRWRQYATPADIEARSAAIRRHNWNKPPGLSARANRRRRQRSGENDWRVERERFDPLADLGSCFG